MIVAQDEGESPFEYYLRQQRLLSYFNDLHEQSEKYEKLLKFMPETDAYEAAYGPLPNEVKQQRIEDREALEKFEKELEEKSLEKFKKMLDGLPISEKQRKKAIDNFLELPKRF